MWSKEKKVLDPKPCTKYFCKIYCNKNVYDCYSTNCRWHDIEKIYPDKIILIDYPGFNLRIAKAVKARFQIPVVYYISPQLWAWKENRIEFIRKYIDENTLKEISKTIEVELLREIK